MAEPSYIKLRSDTGGYSFRYVVPADIRPLVGGRREITKALGTQDRRLALRLARRLAAMLERFTWELGVMAKKKDIPETFVGLTLTLIERQLADGTKESQRIYQTSDDPAEAEKDREALLKILGTTREAAAPADERSLSALVKAYFAEGDREKRWTAKTRSELDAIYKLMLEILGTDKPVSSITRKDAAYLKDMLAKLPSNRSKDPRYRTKSVLELTAMKIPPEDLLSVSSANKALIRVSSLFKYGVQHGWIANNPAEGMTFRKKKRDDEERDQFTDKEVQRLVDAVTSGTHGSDRSPYMKWVPLMGVFTGARLNELCQLEVSDFVEVEGVPCISINDDGAGKRLKNANARRYVPLHPDLIALGLPAFVEEKRKLGQSRLFGELPVGRDGPGQQASKWFARFRERLGIDKEFHAIRHWAINALRRAHVASTTIADLVGHARGHGETERRYMKAAEIEMLRDALSRLHYGDVRAAPSLRVVKGGQS